MRVRLGNKIIDFNYVCQPGGTDSHIYLGKKNDSEHYVVDCKNAKEAKMMLNQLLVNGYFDIDTDKYDYSNDLDWR